MAHKVNIGQQFADFSDTECDTRHYQHSEYVQLFKRESRPLEAAKAQTPNKSFNDKLKYYKI